jgi:hypothetical protein
VATNSHGDPGAPPSASIQRIVVRSDHTFHADVPLSAGSLQQVRHVLGTAFRDPSLAFDGDHGGSSRNLTEGAGGPKWCGRDPESIISSASPSAVARRPQRPKPTRRRTPWRSG